MEKVWDTLFTSNYLGLQLFLEICSSERAGTESMVFRDESEISYALGKQGGTRRPATCAYMLFSPRA